MRTLVIAPHPDDEVLGCGGTLLRRKAEGGEVGWLIATGISEAGGWPGDKVRSRNAEIDRVAGMFGFSHVFNLHFETTLLDTLPMATVVEAFSGVFREFEPEEVLIPHRGDVHTDHRVVFDAAIACTKWFRYPSVRRVLAYETLSETDFGLEANGMHSPNYFVDISAYLERKLEIMAVYESEVGPAPFPRSNDVIRALATVRGAASGCLAAEGFQLLRERI